MGGKNTENKSVGQPIFKQLIDCIPKSKFDALVSRHQVCRYYQRVYDLGSVVGPVCLGYWAVAIRWAGNVMGVQGKLNHPGLTCSPAKGMSGDGLGNRGNEFFRELYFILLGRVTPILSVSRIHNVSFSNLYIFDWSAIRLFSDITKGSGSGSSHGGKKKGGPKVYVLIDAQPHTPTFKKTQIIRFRRFQLDPCLFRRIIFSIIKNRQKCDTLQNYYVSILVTCRSYDSGYCNKNDFSDCVFWVV